MKEKGFTLVELLAAILILGILLSLAVPSILKYMRKGTDSYYNSVEDMILVAGRDYVHDYPTLLPIEIGNVTVIQLPELSEYIDLDDIVDENKKTCSAKVIIKKKDKQNYDYYTCLSCEGYQTEGDYCEYKEEDNIVPDSKNYSLQVDKEKYVIEQGTKFDLPFAKAYYNDELVDSNVVGSPRIIDTNKLGITTVTYSYHGAKKQIKVEIIETVKPSIPEVVLRYDNKNGKVYNGNWYSKNIYAEFKSTDYTKSNVVGSGIDYYEISTDKDNWIRVNGNNYLHRQTENKVYYVRSVDKLGNIGEVNSYRVKIDQVIPNPPRITASDNISSNIWHNSNFNISFSGANNISGNTYYYGVSASPSVVGTSVSFTSNQTPITYYAKVCSGAGLCSTNSSYIAKLDKSTPNLPIITASDNKANNTWHNSNYTLTGSGGGNISGNIYYYGTSPNPTSTTVPTISTNTTGTTYYVKTCSGAGICNGDSTYIAKLDKTTPNPPIITASDNKASNTWHNSNFSISFSGASNISGNTYYWGTTTTPTIVGTSISFVSNTQSVPYYVRVCSGSGLCSSNNIYIVKVDKQQPTLAVKNDTNYITTTTGQNPSNYFNVTTGLSSGTINCTLNGYRITNTNQLSLGVNTLTCTITSGSGITSTPKNITFRHQYQANVHCSSGTVSGSNCIVHYDKNEGKCGGCAVRSMCEANDCPPKTCADPSFDCKSYSCRIPKDCVLHVCNFPNGGSTSECFENSPASAGGMANFDSTCASTGNNGAHGTVSHGSCSSCGTKPASGSACDSPDATNKTCTGGWNERTDGSVCGYNSCRSNQCSCETGKSCDNIENEHRYYQCDTVGNNGSKGQLSGTTCSF